MSSGDHFGCQAEGNYLWAKERREREEAKAQRETELAAARAEGIAAERARVVALLEAEKKRVEPYFHSDGLRWPGLEWALRATRREP